MPSPAFTEHEVEIAALEWLKGLGWSTAHGPDIGPEGPRSERTTYHEVVLRRRLGGALSRLNPDLPAEALDDACRKLIQPEGSALETRNRAFHRMLVEGVTVEYRPEGQAIRGAQVRILDYANPANNDWLAVNQFTVVDGERQRRPDIVLFVNGLPLGLVELKNTADERATIWNAWQQLQTYKTELPDLFSFNEVLIVSDGVNARLGSLTAGREWFKAWRTMDGKKEAGARSAELKVMLRGACQPRRFLALVRDFIVFEDDGGRLSKKVAGYHQFHAVEAAVEQTVRAATLRRESLLVAEQTAPYSSPAASGNQGDRRIGVVWHTQGSGKSLTMVFFSGRIVREPRMENPTIVVLTDRNDLDDQLFSTFSRCQDILRQPPVQARDRADLRSKLAVQSGGIVFTTIQKFFPEESGDRMPELSRRRNVVVIADEAHRSQYDFIDGYARHMRDALPRASFIGFTGTPIALNDADTRAVFGDYISVYDIKRAVQDKATVPIYYESRLAKLALDDDERSKINEAFEEATQGKETQRKERLKAKWAQLEAIAGAPNRVSLIAKDISTHFQARLKVLAGKAMVVCMSRRICVSLYRELARLNPGWHDDDDAKGRIKVVMTGSAADPSDWQPHIRAKARRELLAKRFRDPEDPLQIVLVCDMWLTGFDAPSLHTMYVDKPMRGHGLMQAIARVNRVFHDKPGGLVVDYLGIAHELKRALAAYTESGGQGSTTLDVSEAVRVMLEKYEVCRNLFYGFDYSDWVSGAASDRLDLLPQAQEHILAQENGKERLLRTVTELTRAFALAAPHRETARIRDDVGFFQAVRSVLAKNANGAGPRATDELDGAIRQIMSRAVVSEGVQDIFRAAGLEKPDISILSEEFLSEVRGMKRRNLAAELLQKLIRGELASRKRKNVVQARSFAEMLDRSLRRYANRTIEAAQVIEELIRLARDLREADARGSALGLSDDELAFYDALETNDSAVAVLGDAVLRDIARSLVEVVRRNVTIDWTLRENVRAHLRRLVKRLLRKRGYPPDKRESATRTVLEQAEALSAAWISEDGPTELAVTSR